MDSSRSGQSRRGSFRAAVLNNAAEQRKGMNFGHLALPRGVSLFKEMSVVKDRRSPVVNLDILPYFVTDTKHPDRNEEFDAAIEGKLWYRRPYLQHGRIGANNTTIVCPRSISKKCPICEDHDRLRAEGAAWDSPEMSGRRPQRRNLYYVMFPEDVGDYETERAYLWDIAHGNFQELLFQELELKEEYADFALLDGGFTLAIRFAVKSFSGTEYAVASRIDFKPRKNKYTENLVRELTALDEVLIVKSYSEVSRIFFDTSGEDEGSEGVNGGAGSGAARAASLSSVAQASSGRDDKCPHGYRFGWDTDTKSECGECEVWGACMDAREENVRVAEKAGTVRVRDDESPIDDKIPF